MLANLLIGRIGVGIFAAVLSSSRPLFGAALHNANTFFLLGSAFFIYLFFRLFLLCWRFLNHLRRHYFTWSLTYYFLVIVVCLAFRLPAGGHGLLFLHGQEPAETTLH